MSYISAITVWQILTTIGIYVMHFSHYRPLHLINLSLCNKNPKSTSFSLTSLSLLSFTPPPPTPQVPYLLSHPCPTNAAAPEAKPLIWKPSKSLSTLHSNAVQVSHASWVIQAQRIAPPLKQAPTSSSSDIFFFRSGWIYLFLLYFRFSFSSSVLWCFLTSMRKSTMNFMRKTNLVGCFCIHGSFRFLTAFWDLILVVGGFRRWQAGGDCERRFRSGRAASGGWKIAVRETWERKR